MTEMFNDAKEGSLVSIDKTKRVHGKSGHAISQTDMF